MAQDCTIDFSNLTIDVPDGTITIGESATVCINQTITLPNLAFQAEAGAPNPGIIWAVYLCPPTEIDPNLDADCNSNIVLLDGDENVIIGGGEADFSFTNLPSNPGDTSITVFLVPIIDVDTEGILVEGECTGIAVGLDYPSITFLVPEDNPTQCDSDCKAFEVNDECADAIGLSLQSGTVVFPTEADSAYSNICATRETDLEAPSCFTDINIANTVWFSFEGTGGEYTISVTNCEAATVPLGDSQMVIYEGTCGSTTQVGCSDDIGGGNLLSSVTDFPTTAGGAYLIMVDGFENESGQFCIEVTETKAPCDANFGTVNFEGESTTCDGGGFNFTLTGDNTADGFTSGFVVVDDSGMIVNILAPGDINLTPGTYTIFAINYDDANADAVNGATTIEELNALDACLDLQQMGMSITVLEDGVPDCCDASILSLSPVDGEISVCQVEGESLDFTVNGANTDEGFSNVWYFEQNGAITLGGVVPSNIPNITFNPNVLGIETGIALIYVVNVSEADEQAVIDAINAGQDIGMVVASEDICAALVSNPFVVTILASTDPNCIACEPNAGESMASLESTCEESCIVLTVNGNNQNTGFSTLLLITTSDDAPILDAIPAGEVCLEAGTYTIYSFNLFILSEAEILDLIANGTSLADLQLLIETGNLCGIIEAEGTVVTFLEPTDDACFECDAAVGAVVNEDTTICFGDPLTFQVTGDNTATGFNTQFLGVEEDGTIIAFVEDNVAQTLPVGTLEFYAINFAEVDEPSLIEIIANDVFQDLLDLIDANGICAEISSPPILVTVLPEDHPSCTGEPFDAMITDTTISDDGSTYTITITMTGGSGDYTIDGDPVDGNIFVSEPIPCGESFSFEASDGTFIEILEGIAPCPEPCTADPGTMPQLEVVNPICDGDATDFTTIGASLGTDDILIYVLHDSETAQLGNILATNTVGVFDINSSMQINTNTVYYVSAFAGPDADGNGIPDSDTECNVVIVGTPVVFLEPVSFMVDEFCDTQTGDYLVSFQLEGGLPAFDNTTDYTISGDFSGAYSPGQDAITVTYLAGSANQYVFTFSDDAGCATFIESDTFECIKNPIELLSFEGEIMTEGNYLQWITASEIDNDYFALERSLDGENFEVIAEVKSQGNSINLQSYEFMDRTAPSGVSYYRLRQVDFNGTTTTTHVVALQRGESGFEIVQVYPNPTRAELNILFTSSAVENIEVTIYSSNGQQMLQSIYENQAGSNSILVDVNAYPTGVYLISLHDGSKTEIQRFVKE